MSRIEQIERDIQELSPSELDEVTQWVIEFRQKRWEDQIDRDAASGKLQFLFDEATQAVPDKEWPPQP